MHKSDVIGGFKMGFFDGLKEGLGVKSKSDYQEVIDMYNEEDDELSYREKGLENSSSNNGWYTCIKCGKKYRRGDMDVDHIVPKSKGGDSSRENLQLICKHCNRSKRADMSDTYDDLNRRRLELDKQDQDDIEYLRKVMGRK